MQRTATPRPASPAAACVGAARVCVPPSTARRSAVPPRASAGGSAGGATPQHSSSLAAKLKAFLARDKVDKAAMARLGLGAVASYGAVSNITYGTGLALSWIAFVKQKAVSPLAPGKWPAFLAFFAAFWMTQNFLRPLRLSAALAMAPLFDRFIAYVEARTGLSRGGAFGVYLALLGSVTCVAVFGSIFLACGPAAYAR